MVNQPVEEDVPVIVDVLLDSTYRLFGRSVWCKPLKNDTTRYQVGIRLEITLPSDHKLLQMAKK